MGDCRAIRQKEKRNNGFLLFLFTLYSLLLTAVLETVMGSRDRDELMSER